MVQDASPGPSADPPDSQGSPQRAGGAEPPVGALVRQLAERHTQLHALAQPFGLRGHQLRITTSIGIALYPEHGAEPEPLIEHADIALYQAKARGRARVEVFAEAMKAELPARRALVGAYAVNGPDPR
jgi:predicted signal transduction protein with EAL and GGDEF domain